MKHHAWPCWAKCKSVGWRCKFDRSMVEGTRDPGSFNSSTPLEKLPAKRKGSSSNNGFSAAMLRLQGCNKAERAVHFFGVFPFVFGMFCPVFFWRVYCKRCVLWWCSFVSSTCQTCLYLGRYLPQVVMSSCAFNSAPGLRVWEKRYCSWKRSQDTPVLLRFVMHLLGCGFQDFGFYLYHGKMMENDPIWLAYFSWMNFRPRWNDHSLSWIFQIDAMIWVPTVPSHDIQIHIPRATQNWSEMVPPNSHMLFPIPVFEGNQTSGGSEFGGCHG